MPISREKSQGFTLIELMIAVVVVAILAAVALPSYQESIRKSRRADAKIALEQVAAQQERWFTENNTYTNDLNDLGGSGGKITSPEGYYEVTMTNAGCVSGSYVSCFDLTAQPVSGGAQAGDTHCASFTLDETGSRGATNSDCW